MTSEYKRPLPVSTTELDTYWEKAKAHELWIKRCGDCNKAFFYPREICPNCFSRNTSWIKCSGRGTLHAFAIVHRAPMPAFGDHVPYVTAFIDLEEGARIPSNLVDVEFDPAKIKIGTPVEVVFEDVTAEVTLPKFRLVS
jgi:uncharacterized OB-fold protein